MSKERFIERQADVRDPAARLSEAVAQAETELIRDATIQRFEFTFEVVWKTLKLYLEHQGNECGGPRPTLKQAFAAGLIPTPDEADVWMLMFEDRNLTSHAYDLAGNMIEKSVGGIKTKMSYDTANRLLASTIERQAGQIEQVAFKYDPAGRLTAQTSGQETTSYQYGLFEKTSGVIKPDGSRIGFDYWPNGQMAAKGSLPSAVSAVKSADEADPFGIKAAMAAKNTGENNALTVATAGDQFKETETMLWDGLALLQRGGEAYTVEPHLSGGIPLTAYSVSREACGAPSMLISDFLGTTLGIVQGETFTPVPLTAFGEAITQGEQSRRSLGGGGFFTGKPWDSDLQSYNFLFRNYQPQMARWTSVDPSGFPDGANNFVYAAVPTNQCDPLGLKVFIYTSTGSGGTPGFHSFIVVQPDNPSDFSKNQQFLPSNSGGMTVGAYASGSTPFFYGNLTYIGNGDLDSNMNVAGTNQGEISRPTGMTDSQFIQAILTTANNYQNNLPYGLLPETTRGYNCNSFVAGILDLLKIGTPSSMTQYAGFGTPVPAKNFHAE